jgi:hypothetical protein
MDQDKYTNPPWAPLQSSRWSGFCAFYSILKKDGFDWEAQRIQGMLLPVVDFDVTMSTFIQKNQFADVAHDIEAGRIDESVILTELIISNNICDYLLQ